MITQKTSKTSLIVGVLCLWHAVSAFVQNLLPRYAVMVMSIVLYCSGLITSNAALAGGFITMQPQDAFVDRGNSLQLIATFRPVGNSSTDWGIMVAYEWKFQRSTDGQESVIKSGLWRGVGAFELLIPNSTDNHAGKYRIVFRNKNVPKSAPIESRWAIVTVGDGGSTVTPVIPVTPLVLAPSITRQPQSQAVSTGASVTFFVIATDTSSLSYQWRKNGVNISGANRASYAIGNVQTSHAGSYTVAVSNSGGSTSSLNALLTVTTGGVTVPSPYAFTTIAGLAGSRGSADGTGSVARFNKPEGIAVDSVGVVYVVDTGNHTIRKITPGGVVSTLAGLTGSWGSADGKGSAARFNSPTGIAYGGGENVFVADWGNHTIRKITPDGMVSTMAGLAGSIGSVDGTGNTARFSGPRYVAVDKIGTVYVTDIISSTIRRITPGGVVSTMAGLAGSIGSSDGTGSAARFNGPFGLAVDIMGIVYVADRGNNTIRKITTSGGVSTLAGRTGHPGSSDGIGDLARFEPLYGVAVDNAGNVYVTESGHTVRRITPGGQVSTLAGLALIQGSADGTGSMARFNNPEGIAVDSVGVVYVVDTGNHTIRKGVPSTGVANTLPIITSQPLSQTVFAGQNVTFPVTATGTPPLSYKWRKESASLDSGERISGASTSILTIASVLTTDSGNYSVMVSNSSGAVTSSSMLLTVKANPLSEVKLSVRVNGNEIIISWSDPAATLEEADSVTGPWKSVVGGSTSPLLLPMSANRKFYSLRKSDEGISNASQVPAMVWIPAGTFTMGSPVTEKGHFGPQTAVMLTKGFWIGKYELKQREYLAIMGSNPSSFSRNLDRPVEIVSWNDAVGYCDKLTQRERAEGKLPEGYVYRLPTEAEWEYACRAGTTTVFSYGDDPSGSRLEQYAWYSDNSWSSMKPRGYSWRSGEKYYTSQPVGTKQPNPWGLYDMHGNVREWCLDWWEWSLPGGSVTDPKGRTSGTFRVYRGGSWLDDGWDCRSASRIYAPPNFRYFDIGFRPVLAPSQ